jgi:hypothetical protein
MGNRPGPRMKEYGDPGFKGRGHTKCFNCGRPTRDHPKAGPCFFPAMDAEMRDKALAKYNEGKRPRE